MRSQQEALLKASETWPTSKPERHVYQCLGAGSCGRWHLRKHKGVSTPERRRRKRRRELEAMEGNGSVTVTIPA